MSLALQRQDFGPFTLYMTKVNLNMKIYHPFIRYLSYIRILIGKCLLQSLIDVATTKPLSKLLTTCLAKITCHLIKITFLVQ